MLVIRKNDADYDWRVAVLCGMPNADRGGQNYTPQRIVDET